MLLIGNIIALVGQCLIVISSSIKSRRQTLVVQGGGIFTLAIANIFLGGFAGLVANLVSVVRNALFVYEKNSRGVVTGLVVAYIVATLTVELIVGFPDAFWMLPPLINVLFTLFAHLESWRFKIMNGSLFLLWLIYDVSVGNYVSAPFDIANIVANAITVHRIRASGED